MARAAQGTGLVSWLAGWLWLAGPRIGLGGLQEAFCLPHYHAPKQTPPGIAIQDPALISNAARRRTLRPLARRQMMHRTASHCTAPCHAGAKQASNQASNQAHQQARLSLAPPPCASSHSLPDAECQNCRASFHTANRITNRTAPHAPHRTAPHGARSSQRHSFKPLSPPPLPAPLPAPPSRIPHPP